MPAYDFKCRTCAKVVEVTRAAADDSAVPCPECGGETKRVFSAVGVHFKGGGFHNTDYRKKEPAEAAPAACPSATSGGACEGCPAAAPE
jgi:putative FmdB family regulatory protein